MPFPAWAVGRCSRSCRRGGQRMLRTTSANWIERTVAFSCRSTPPSSVSWGSRGRISMQGSCPESRSLGGSRLITGVTDMPVRLPTPPYATASSALASKRSSASPRRKTYAPAGSWTASGWPSRRATRSIILVCQKAILAEGTSSAGSRWTNGEPCAPHHPAPSEIPRPVV